MKNIRHIAIYSTVICITAFGAIAPLHATNCFSKDDKTIKKMYKIFLKSGKTPHVKSPVIKAVEPSVTLDGNVVALTNFERCWKDNPPCKRSAKYAQVHIESMISFDDIQRNYGGDAKAVMYECFMRIGASGKYKTKYNTRR